jgi:hypothetical protein
MPVFAPGIADVSLSVCPGPRTSTSRLRRTSPSRSMSTSKSNFGRLTSATARTLQIGASFRSKSKSCSAAALIVFAAGLRAAPAVLRPEQFRHYAGLFNRSFPEDVVNYIPDAKAWAQLSDPRGFAAPCGPTTAEQRASGFRIAESGDDCQWNGPSWPFSTSLTLSALGNVLRDYPQKNVTRQDYFHTFPDIFAKPAPETDRRHRRSFHR